MAAAAPAPLNSPATTSGPSTITTASPAPPVITNSTPTTQTTTTVAVVSASSPSPAAATAYPTNQSSSKPAGLPTITIQRADPPKTLRGLNKPKCIKCGNVARSRCPYQSCKSCCAKAQNPCHIHVLKPNSTLADRSPSDPTIPEQQTNNAPATGPSHKAASIRQLSSNFAQFNNLQVSRSRRPLTRKEAIAVNEWRFGKLKEFRERNIAGENEAFDRYMQNISLLEEVFDGYRDGNTMEEGCSGSGTSNKAGGKLLTAVKVKSRSDPVRIDRLRKRIENAVDQGARKLQKTDSRDSIDMLDDEASEPAEALKMNKNQSSGKMVALNELNDRVNRGRNEDDLKSCLKMMYQISGEGKITEKRQTEGESSDNLKDDATEAEGPKSTAVMGSDCLVLKLVRTTVIDQETLKSMHEHFSSIEEIEDL